MMTKEPKAKGAKLRSLATKEITPVVPRGRPTLYNPHIAEEISQRLSKGEPMAVICRSEGMPAARTVRSWVEKDEAFAAVIARAREEGFDVIATDCLEIADDSSRDYRETEDGPAFDAEHVQRSKLRIETRLKLLAKWDPKRYGEKIETTHMGSVGVVLNATPSDEAL